MSENETIAVKRSKRQKRPNSRYHRDSPIPPPPPPAAAPAPTKTQDIDTKTIKNIEQPVPMSSTVPPDKEQDEEIECLYDKELGETIDIDCLNEEGMDCVDVETTIDDDLDSTSTSITASTQNHTSPNTKSPSANKNKRTSKQNISPSATKELQFNATPPSTGNKKSTRKRRGSGSSGEERWLTAIESGKLEDVDDEMKKIKDPKLMTARQRAMYERTQDPTSVGTEFLMSLPNGAREREKPQTAEDIQKAVLKNQKRKQLADEKREKDKKKTMERLLKKQESKQRSGARNKIMKNVEPMITYKSTKEGAIIQMPIDFDFPLQQQAPRAPPKIQLCGIKGCNERKRYNSANGLNFPLCSLGCYRKHIQNISNNELKAK